MELKGIILKRKSVRKFQKKAIPNLEEIIALARTCPSAGGIRGYSAIFTQKKIVSVDAPIYIVICTKPDAYAKRYGDRGRNLYSIQDATIFGTYLQLLLVDMGLASVWIGTFNENRIKTVIGTELRPIAIIALGYT